MRTMKIQYTNRLCLLIQCVTKKVELQVTNPTFLIHKSISRTTTSIHLPYKSYYLTITFLIVPSGNRTIFTPFIITGNRRPDKSKNSSA